MNNATDRVCLLCVCQPLYQMLLQQPSLMHFFQPKSVPTAKTIIRLSSHIICKLRVVEDISADIRALHNTPLLVHNTLEYLRAPPALYIPVMTLLNLTRNRSRADTIEDVFTAISMLFRIIYHSSEDDVARTSDSSKRTRMYYLPSTIDQAEFKQIAIAFLHSLATDDSSKRSSIEDINENMLFILSGRALFTDSAHTARLLDDESIRRAVDFWSTNVLNEAQHRVPTNLEVVFEQINNVAQTSPPLETAGALHDDDQTRLWSTLNQRLAQINSTSLMPFQRVTHYAAHIDGHVKHVHFVLLKYVSIISGMSLGTLQSRVREMTVQLAHNIDSAARSNRRKHAGANAEAKVNDSDASDSASSDIVEVS